MRWLYNRNISAYLLLRVLRTTLLLSRSALRSSGWLQIHVNKVVIAYISSNLIKKHFVILRLAYKLISGDMIFKYPFKALLTTIVPIILFDFNTSFAQAPNISYPTPQHYTAGTTITPLSPGNKGGNVPANTYGLVSTFAGNNKNGSSNGQGAGSRL